MPRIRRILLVILALAATGCVVSETRPVVYMPAEQAETEIEREKRLSVGIVVLDPGVPEDRSNAAEKIGVPAEVREAEAQFIAYHLKHTLERTALWGPVRVTPEPREGAELIVTGEILHSDGETMEIEVRAVDATGREWLERKYKGRADSGTYSDSELMGRDPFQNIYNEVANDLLEARRQLDRQALIDIRRVAELRFAGDLAPEVYGDYLAQPGSGQYKVVRLPAENDPMLQRMRSIRDRDQLFLDTLNEHYSSFYRQMEDPYDTWRKYSYDEAVALKELRAAARWRKLVGAAAVVGSVMMESDTRTEAVAQDVMLIGGIELFRQGLQVGKEAKMQEEVLTELGTSFGQEIEPVVVEVAGETRRLEGSAATQYAEWRKLLRDIYRAETGVDPAAAPTSTHAPVPGEAEPLASQ